MHAVGVPESNRAPRWSCQVRDGDASVATLFHLPVVSSEERAQQACLGIAADSVWLDLPFSQNSLSYPRKSPLQHNRES